MASAFSDSLMAFLFLGGRLIGNIPPRSNNYKRYEYEITHGSTYKEAQNQNIFDISGLVRQLQTKIQKISIFGNKTSRHANFTARLSILTPEVNPDKFILTSQRFAMLQNNL